MEEALKQSLLQKPEKDATDDSQLKKALAESEVTYNNEMGGNHNPTIMNKNDNDDMKDSSDGEEGKADTSRQHLDTALSNLNVQDTKDKCDIPKSKGNDDKKPTAQKQMNISD